MKSPILQRRSLVLAASIVLTFVLGFVDYATGYEFQFFAFYFLPVTVAAWRVGRRSAFLTAFLCAAVWLAADIASGHPYSNRALAFWNAFIRLISYLIVAYVVSRMHSVLSEERKISTDLRNALQQIKTLSGLLPICANCKKIRNDKGYWQQVESYLTDHSDLEFTHCICEECMKKLYPQFVDPESIGKEGKTGSS
jgi:K+-sensing histidine kinase KdpD